MSEFETSVREYLLRTVPLGAGTGDSCTLEGFAAIVSQLAIREVARDIREGHVPGNVSSFAELHDHVDANGYGGAFEVHFDSSDECLNFWNTVQGNVDKWIKAGKPSQFTIGEL